MVKVGGILNACHSERSEEPGVSPAQQNRGCPISRGFCETWAAPDPNSISTPLNPTPDSPSPAPAQFSSPACLPKACQQGIESSPSRSDIPSTLSQIGQAPPIPSETNCNDS